MTSTATGLLFSLLCLLASLHVSFSASEQLAFESVPDLEKSMYMVLDGYPCVRLLNLSGEIGCANPGLDKVVAPIVRFKNGIELVRSTTILVPLYDFDRLLSRVSSDSNFARNVAGVLVESGTQNQTHLTGSSPDKKFPQAEFAPYENNKFEWNPTGSGSMWRRYDFPVFLLSESSTQTLQEIAVKNENKKETYAADVTEFDLVMQTTKAGTHDSESCLREGTCLPLGGYSVWSALPTTNVSASSREKPVVLTVASMDSASFFRDKSLGADSPISGMISLLAAVDALSRIEDLDTLAKQLVFVVFTGEAWGYLGSRRFLLELDQHTDAVHGINNTLIETVIEVGSVGKGYDQGVKTFYAHTTGVSSATNETLKALQQARDSLGTESIKYSTASKSNPGIPPSSFMSFSRQNPHAAGVVLEDFDSAFTNKFYHSHLDDISNINSSAIVAAASLVARTLYILASDNKDLSSSSLNAVNVNTSLVDELLGCLLSCEPGLSCELVKRYITPSSTCPSHYVGVIQGDPSLEPFLGYVGDVPRFVWNFMADRTSTPLKDVSPCSENCSMSGGVCIKQEIDGKGICVTSTTRYVPAYSTRLKYESGTWSVLPPNSSDLMGAADPVWAESNWNVIGLRVYSVQGAAYDRLILMAGVVVTALSYLLIVIVKAIIAKALKQD
ncbi:nicastrin isoform X1 [Cynara cardunculus var. scolymus]|uniref:nicastrin isoform X1 n=1 Tax=Cynara cardunculus var. scolymus TaxID=59895 RepID=UPI000D63037F|nr:nicastrin isoform X1 [Cynara cardunculus var. scolymus]